MSRWRTLMVCVTVAFAVAACEKRSVPSAESLAAAADSAVLAAISSAREAERNGLPGIPKLAKTAAQNAWNANLAADSSKRVKGLTVLVTKQGSAWTATVSYDVLATHLLHGRVRCKVYESCR